MSTISQSPEMVTDAQQAFDLLAQFGRMNDQLQTLIDKYNREVPTIVEETFSVFNSQSMTIPPSVQGQVQITSLYAYADQSCFLYLGQNTTLKVNGGGAGLVVPAAKILLGPQDKRFITYTSTINPAGFITVCLWGHMTGGEGGVTT